MNKTFISILIAAVLVSGIMVFQATKTSSSKVLTPTELAVSLGTDMTRIRVGGRVANTGIHYKTEPEILLEFTIYDPLNTSDTPKTIPVHYEGLKPDMFAPERDVIIDGELKDGVLLASSLLTQCPSKYEPPDGPEHLIHEKSK